MNLNPGEMTRRITLLYPRSVPTDSGDQTVTWVDGDPVWARKRPLSGKERYSAMQVQDLTDVEYVIRKRRDVDARWRIRDGNETYQITRPPYDPDDDGQWLVIMCATAVV